MNDEVQPDAPRTTGQQFGRRSWAGPWKIKMVETSKTIGTALHSRPR